MPKLIDADKLKEHYAWWDNEDKKIFDTIVDLQPTVDAIPVVRCKECIHNSLNRKSGNAYCDLGIGLFQLYDYCSRGERKDE